MKLNGIKEIEVRKIIKISDNIANVRIEYNKLKQIVMSVADIKYSNTFFFLCYIFIAFYNFIFYNAWKLKSNLSL